MSKRRNKHRPRCLGCGLTPATCVCAELPRVRFSTPVAIVQHVREKHKPTNTGRLFANLVESASLLSCEIPGVPFDPTPLRDPSVEWRLIFPRDGAPVLDPGQPAAAGRRVGFVLLDGTWSQCARLSRRLPGVAQLPCFALPAGPPSFWTVRTQPREGGCSTFEAAVRALELVEGSGAVAPLRQAFAMITARLLFMKGKLPSPAVPAGWTV